MNRICLCFVCLSETRLTSCFILCRKISAAKNIQPGSNQLSHNDSASDGASEVGKSIEGIAENDESLLPMIVGNNVLDTKV